MSISFDSWNLPGPTGKVLLFALTLVAAATAQADWAQWRGPARDGISPEPLPTTLPEPPKLIWKLSVAHGYAAPVVTAGKLIYLDDAGGMETVHCVNSADGKEQWKNAFAETYTDEFEPGPRCTPVVDEDRLYVQSCKGEFQCLNLTDGKVRWRFHFSDYGAFWVPEKNSPVGSANRRGNAGAPVIDGSRIIIQVGSTNGASLCSFDKVSGKLLWKSQNDLTSYTSPVIGKLGGIRQVVTATCDGLLALDTENGTLCWRVPFKTGANRNVLTPILEGDTVTFASFTTGLRRLKVSGPGPEQKVADEWFNKQIRINLATPVLVGGYLYGLGGNKDYICVEAATGKLKWSQPGFDAVASSISDGHRVLVANDIGEVILLEANPEKFTELGRFQACGKTFSHPAYAGGVVYIRDSRELTAWRVLESPSPQR
ncbi:MAG TPA: PQQ-binding-like beta-propeller repeat protein [Candidatus Limnocylindria bacterium]|jgi:outer membrane protein assembly factor BamB|nr:PQQ-binding-like beta-propeller repeat protein [Candidatus Limnocylindria bacterium]